MGPLRFFQNKMPLRQMRKSLFLSGLIILICLGFSLTIRQLLLRHTQQGQANRFHEIVREVQSLLDAPMNALYGIRGLWALGHGEITSQDLRKYAASREFYKNFPGCLGFGFVRYVKKSDLQKYLVQQRKWNQNFGEIKHYSHPTPHLPFHFVVESIEPSESMVSAIGYDLASNANRREAAVRAMVTGQATITEKIQLLNNDANEAGFLHFLPVYKSYLTPSTEAERIKQIVGWAFTPILLSQLMESVFHTKESGLDIALYEKTVQGDDRLLFQSGKKIQPVSGHEIFESAVQLGGRKWKIYAKGGLDPVYNLDNAISLLTFLVLLLSSSMILFQYQSQGDRRQRAESELEKSQTTLKAILDATKIGIWDWDIVSNQLKWDQNMYPIYGISQDRFDGFYQSWTNSVHPDDRKMMEQELERILRGGKGGEIRFRILLPDQSIRYVASRSHVVFDQGKPVRMYGINSDVTEQVLNELKIMSSAKMSSLGEMAGGIAHEINNPLTIIMAKAGQLEAKIAQGRAEPEVIRVSLSKIIATCERIAKIIKGLREFSRNSEFDPMLKTPIQSILDTTLELCRERFRNQGIDLRIQLDGNETALECREIQISQALMNLLSNAYDAILNCNEKWIELSVKREGDRIKISVTDSGRGISDEVVMKMMQPFFTTKEIGKGTGLGLSITQGIVEDHHGTLKYEKSPEGHTRFVIDLPLVQPKKNPLIPSIAA